jgi:PAS domain S-box-containing protein
MHDIIATLFKGARNPVLIKDTDSRYVFVSDQACTLIGATLEELLGKNDHDFLPKAEADEIRAMDRHIARTGEERLFEEEITARDGSSLRTLITHKRRVTLPAPDGEGTVQLIIAEIDDVTDLRHAEQVLRASEEHHRSLIELHPQTPWVANAAGELIEVGAEWEQFSGRPVDEACGYGWMNTVHPEDLPRVIECWKVSLKTGGRLDVECRLRTRDGDYRWYRSRAAPRCSAAGEILRWYGLLEDIHDRRIALQALMESECNLLEHRAKLEKLVEVRTAEVEQKNTELARLLQHEREVNVLQRRFVAMVSHEFRTPLTIIDAAAQRLSRLKQPPTPEYLAEKSIQIKGSVARMVELMESILAAGRLETGIALVNKAPSSLRDLIEGCASRRQELSRSHRIHIDLEDMPDLLEIDIEAMDRVFTNLFSNAVKYAPGAPDIYVRSWREEGILSISVKDSGVGMNEEDIPRLFEPYFRAQSATGIAGTGIGLNIVREVIELHDGKISVESRLGHGSTFTVCLPCNDARIVDKQAA